MYYCQSPRFFLFNSVSGCITAGFLPCLLVRERPVGEHGPAEHVLDVARAAWEAVLQLLHQLLLAQAVDHRRHALRQAEEGEDDHGAALLGLAADHVALLQHGQHEADKVGQEEDRQLAEVQRDGPAAGAVAAVEHAEAAALQQDPDVAAEEEEEKGSVQLEQLGLVLVIFRPVVLGLSLFQFYILIFSTRLSIISCCFKTTQNRKLHQAQ